MIIFLTSIKTRIETYVETTYIFLLFLVEEELPLKQGLKHEFGDMVKI